MMHCSTTHINWDEVWSLRVIIITLLQSSSSEPNSKHDEWICYYGNHINATQSLCNWRARIHFYWYFLRAVFFIFSPRLANNYTYQYLFFFYMVLQSCTGQHYFIFLPYRAATLDNTFPLFIMFFMWSSSVCTIWRSYYFCYSGWVSQTVYMFVWFSIWPARVFHFLSLMSDKLIITEAWRPARLCIPHVMSAPNTNTSVWSWANDLSSSDSDVTHCSNTARHINTTTKDASADCATPGDTNTITVYYVCSDFDRVTLSHMSWVFFFKVVLLVHETTTDPGPWHQDKMRRDDNGASCQTRSNPLTWYQHI